MSTHVVAPDGLTIEYPSDADTQQQEELLKDLLVTVQHFRECLAAQVASEKSLPLFCGKMSSQ